jgi:hypothetical protein
LQNQERRGRPLTDQDIKQLRRGALRIDAGRAVRFNFIEYNKNRLLLVSSLTRGPVIYRWAFDKIDSLTGAISVSSDSTDEYAYVLGSQRASVVSVGRAIVYDDVGKITRKCPENRCLMFKAAASELYGNTQWPKIEGLQGERRVYATRDGCATGDECTVIVSGGIPRDEVPCGIDGEGISGPGLPTGRASPPLPCQRLGFDIVQVSGPSLFANVSIDTRGDLTLAYVGGTLVSALTHTCYMPVDIGMMHVYVSVLDHKSLITSTHVCALLLTCTHLHVTFQST